MSKVLSNRLKLTSRRAAGGPRAEREGGRVTGASGASGLEWTGGEREGGRAVGGCAEWSHAVGECAKLLGGPAALCCL